MSAPVYLVKGSDPILREDAVEQLVTRLLEGDDRTLALEELTVPGRASPGEADPDSEHASPAEGRETVIAAVLNAAQCPPFMTRRRLVVVRDVEHLTTADAQPLVDYFAAPLESTALVFVAAGGRLPANLTKALKGVVEEVGPEAEKTSDVLALALRDADLKLRPEAVKLVGAHLGEDAGRVPQLVALLRSTYGPGSTLDAAEVELYLGDAGSVPVYQLTNAIEAGDVAGALEILARMLTATSPGKPRPMHPLQIMGLLHSHYRRLLRVDDPSITSEADAVAALGGKVKPYPARKAMEQARALGSARLRRSFDHLHRADLDLKGASGMPEDAVIEVLVARLAALSGRARAASRSRR